MCKVGRPLTWRKNFLNLHLLLLDSVPKVSCGEVVLEVRPYLQHHLSTTHFRDTVKEKEMKIKEIFAPG